MTNDILNNEQIELLERLNVAAKAKAEAEVEINTQIEENGEAITAAQRQFEYFTTELKNLNAAKESVEGKIDAEIKAILKNKEIGEQAGVVDAINAYDAAEVNTKFEALKLKVLADVLGKAGIDPVKTALTALDAKMSEDVDVSREGDALQAAVQKVRVDINLGKAPAVATAITAYSNDNNQENYTGLVNALANAGSEPVRTAYEAWTKANNAAETKQQELKGTNKNLDALKNAKVELEARLNTADQTTVAYNAALTAVQSNGELKVHFEGLSDFAEVQNKIQSLINGHNQDQALRKQNRIKAAKVAGLVIAGAGAGMAVAGYFVAPALIGAVGLTATAVTMVISTALVAVAGTALLAGMAYGGYRLSNKIKNHQSPVTTKVKIGVSIGAGVALSVGMAAAGYFVAPALIGAVGLTATALTMVISTALVAVAGTALLAGMVYGGYRLSKNIDGQSHGTGAKVAIGLATATAVAGMAALSYFVVAPAIITALAVTAAPAAIAVMAVTAVSMAVAGAVAALGVSAVAEPAINKVSEGATAVGTKMKGVIAASCCGGQGTQQTV